MPMLFRLGLAGCVLAAVATGCQPDSPSITEVEGALDHHPERPSCHFEPEAITTLEGGDEVVLIEFTYGGGATWWSSSPCHENPDSVTGVLLPAAGVSFGDSVGADGDFIAQQDCAYSQADCVHNVPSPVNAIFIDALLGYSGYMTFDPPVSEISFRVCSNQTHGITAWDSLGNTVVPETVGPSNGFYQDGDLSCDPEGWEEFGIQASGYDISRVRLRRWDPGYTWWDDMTFRREAQPGIECTSVQRGEETTCSIVVTVDQVEAWKFEADSGSVAGPPFTFTDSLHHDTTWVGKAVASGIVSADVVIDSVPQTLTGLLDVSSRESNKYQRFSAESDISYDTVAVSPCPPVLPYYAIPNALAGGRNVNTPFERCGDHIFDPAPIGETVEAGYEHAAVTDSGPNHGLFYVQAGLWQIHRGSYLNWSLDKDENTTRQSLNDNKQYKKCDQANPGPAIPGLANTWEYNVLCEENNFESFLAAIFTHEGMGTLGTAVSQPNGHQARIEKYATSESGDPYLRVESIVAADTAQLNFFVGDRAMDAGDDIFTFSDQHELMEPVWCNENLYLYDTGAEVYQKVLYTDDSNGPGNVVLIGCR